MYTYAICINIKSFTIHGTRCADASTHSPRMKDATAFSILVYGMALLNSVTFTFYIIPVFTLQYSIVTPRFEIGSAKTLAGVRVASSSRAYTSPGTTAQASLVTASVVDYAQSFSPTTDALSSSQSFSNQQQAQFLTMTNANFVASDEVSPPMPESPANPPSQSPTDAPQPPFPPMPESPGSPSPPNAPPSQPPNYPPMPGKPGTPSPPCMTTCYGHPSTDALMLQSGTCMGECDAASTLQPFSSSSACTCGNTCCNLIPV